MRCNSKPGDILSIAQERMHIQAVDTPIIVAISGGIDSTVCYELARKNFGQENIFPYLLDTGFLREKEAEQVRQSFFESFGVNIFIRECKDIFLSELIGIYRDHEKRLIFRKLFFQQLDRIAGEVSAKTLVLGTQFKSSLKVYNNDTHGITFSNITQIIEPVCGIPKPEIRTLAVKLGFPTQIVNRMPFPGPGLLIRIAGQISIEKISLIRKITAIIESHQLCKTVYQFFPILLDGECVRSDKQNRTTGAIIALRVVNTIDQIIYEPRIIINDLQTITTQLLSDPIIARVLVDLTPKPPGTIEFY